MEISDEEKDAIQCLSMGDSVTLEMRENLHSKGLARPGPHGWYWLTERGQKISNDLWSQCRRS